MGADPIVVAVSVTSGEFNGFLVRKAEKQHGTGQRIEGFGEKGARWSSWTTFARRAHRPFRPLKRPASLDSKSSA